jgi:hypothetical protein
MKKNMYIPPTITVRCVECECGIANVYPVTVNVNAWEEGGELTTEGEGGYDIYLDL